MMNDIHILIIEDHYFIRDALRIRLERNFEAHVIEAPDADSALTAYHEHRPQLAILDLHLQEDDPHGLTILEQIVEIDPQAKVIILTGDNGETRLLADAMSHRNVYGICGKVSAGREISTAVQKALEEDTYYAQEMLPKISRSMRAQRNEEEVRRELNELSDRPLQVLYYISKGKLNSDIAAALQISEGTVRSHVYAVTSSLDKRNRELTLFASAYGDVIDELMTTRDLK